MPALIEPTTDLYVEWSDARRDWGAGEHEDGFGLQHTDDVDSEEGFAQWVSRLVTDQQAVYRWVVAEGTVVGAIALRLRWNDHTAEVGHIGFGIRPSARSRGFAGWALREMISECRNRGLDRVLLVCAVDNAASARTIVGAGGIEEGVVETPLGAARRYWITTE